MNGNDETLSNGELEPYRRQVVGQRTHGESSDEIALICGHSIVRSGNQDDLEPVEWMTCLECQAEAEDAQRREAMGFKATYELPTPAAIASDKNPVTAVIIRHMRDQLTAAGVPTRELSDVDLMNSAKTLALVVRHLAVGMMNVSASIERCALMLEDSKRTGLQS